MNKTQILALTNEELFAHALGIESRVTNEVNSRRGISKKTIKEYKWTIEECASRFGLDTEKVISMTGAEHWWYATN